MEGVRRTFAMEIPFPLAILMYPLLRNKGVQFRPADNAGTIHSSRGKIPSNVNAVDAFERLSRTRDRLTLAYATCSRSGRIFGACTLAE